MKKNLHPTNYRPVVFQDINDGSTFLTRSTASSDETIKWEDGKEYPLIKTHISSTSHPFYTGQEKLVDVEGRVDRFKARAEAAKKRKEALKNKAVKSAERSAKKDAADEVVQKVGGSLGTQKPKAAKPAKTDAPADDK